MWELIKNDPILKTIFVVIIGMFAFSFAFSLMFGAGSSGMEHGMGSGGYNAATSLGHIILLLSKIFVIILLVAIIITAVKFIQKHIIGNEPIKGIDNVKNRPLTAILAGVGGVLVLFLVIYMISPSVSNNGVMHQATNYRSMGYGFGASGLLVSVLKLITMISFIGLAVGVVMYFKEQYFNNVKTAPEVKKELCSTCGTEIKSSWKCCPSCGAEKIKAEEIKITTTANGDK